MNVAIIGSRTATNIDIAKYLPKNTTAIVSGGAKGADTCAREYAQSHGIKLMEFLPEYGKYGIAAPVIRNRQIINSCDYVLAFWNGKSRGTKNTLDFARKLGKTIKVVKI